MKIALIALSFLINAAVWATDKLLGQPTCECDNGTITCKSPVEGGQCTPEQLTACKQSLSGQCK